MRIIQIECESDEDVTKALEAMRPTVIGFKPLTEEQEIEIERKNVEFFEKMEKQVDEEFKSL